MSEDTFFELKKHRDAWYNPTPNIYMICILQTAAEAVNLWMEGKIRHSPCNLHDINTCKEVIDKWIKYTHEYIEIEHRILRVLALTQEQRERDEKDLKEEENYLAIFKDYLNELSLYVQGAKLSLAMAFLPRLGQDSPLFLLPLNILQLIAGLVWG